MAKRLFFLFLISIILCGCSCTKPPVEDNNKIYLTDCYYNEGNYIDITSDEVNNKDNETYLLFAYNNFCAFSVPCDNTFKVFMEKYNIDILQIPFDDYKNTYMYDTVKYAPSVILVSNKKVITYLDAEKDAGVNKYEDSNKFESWLEEYINFTKR